MYNLKGFMVFAPLANNSFDVIAPLGELSTHCATFSKEKGQYTNPLYADSKLVSFLSQRTAVDGAETQITTPVIHQNAALNLSQWIYTKSLAQEISEDRDAFASAMIASFGQTHLELAFGEIVGDGVRWMPEWVSYKLNDAEDNRVRLWYADDSFRRQYDEYEIGFVPPIAVLDDFFKDPLIVKAAVEAWSLTSALEKADVLKNRKPETVMMNKVYKYFAQLAPFISLDTNWTIIIWGPAGNNPDIIKQELAKWILANSQHTEEEWMDIFPDIFTSTEFIVTPFWDEVAIEQKTIINGVYSPTVRAKDVISVSNLTIKGKNYTQLHIDENLCVSSVLYGSLAMSVVGGPYNRGGVSKFNDQWPDYINVSTNSPDFNRMQLATQDFVNLLYSMLIVAEKATLFSDIPLGMSRVTRNGIVYIAASMNDILYLVVTKYSMLDI
jgi:hypothetical protein